MMGGGTAGAADAFDMSGGGGTDARQAAVDKVVGILNMGVEIDNKIFNAMRTGDERLERLVITLTGRVEALERELANVRMHLTDLELDTPPRRRDGPQRDDRSID